MSERFEKQMKFLLELDKIKEIYTSFFLINAKINAYKQIYVDNSKFHVENLWIKIRLKFQCYLC